ncbi:rhomboid family intramembrane serine protease [Rubritalea tangerina]|uniref:Rhomboid family intramembrane serine protease n=1 Tax=Rubritalea tangerina TaxID=430798 RepID=A0ABW4ZDI0_9BACT
MSTDQSAPVWARPDVFPARPTTGVFGYVDTKGRRHSAKSLHDLQKQISDSKKAVDLVWTPKSDRLVVPEEVESLRPILEKRRATWARNDITDGRRLSLVMGVATLWAVYASYTNSGGSWDAVIHAPTVAVTAIMLLIFGIVPYYEGWKVLRKAGKRDEVYWQREIADARFDSWLSTHLAPFSFILLAIMVVTCCAQWFGAGSSHWAEESVRKVGLLKQNDPWWRYLTAPLVHGNLVHWLMNFAALRYLARRAEILARWPHMILVFLLSAVVGAMATTYMMPKIPSVGASGGILGLLGFLLVFETLHRELVPKSARKRLLAGLVLVAVMGAVGFSFIDNAAHFGGLVAGMVYAVIVFPPSASVHRPEILVKDRFVGMGAIGVLLAASMWCVYLLVR